MTMVEPSLKKLLDRFGWDLPQLSRGASHLMQKTQTNDGSPVDGVIDTLTDSIKLQLSDLASEVRKIDPQMGGAVEHSRAKITEELQKLSRRLRKSRQNREGTGMRQIRRVCSHLRPRGRLQERVLGPAPFLVAHGESLADLLIEASDPFALEHIVLEL